MKVGMVTGSFAPDSGGGYVIQISLGDAIRSNRSQHSFFLLDVGGGAPDTNELPVFNLPNRYGEATSLNRQLELAIADLGLDIVWFLNPVAECVSIPFISTVWDLQHRRQPYFPEVSVSGWTWQQREQTYRATLPRAFRILTGTQAGKDEIVLFYGVHPDNVRIISLPVPDFIDKLPQRDTAATRAKYGLPDSYLLYPAQFWPHKNHINLLLALEWLRVNHALSIALALTGSDGGNRAHVEKMIRKKGLARQVHILGFIPQEDLVALYRGASALVFPTFFGPDNLPPLEAFALGCPVIASRVPGAEEQLGDAALLFDPNKPEELANAIASLCETSFWSTERRERMIKKGRERASARSSEAYVRNICQLLDEFEPVRRCWPAGRKASVRAEMGVSNRAPSSET
jgi:glycosyltransferase involved in cell wall biosynthesis